LLEETGVSGLQRTVHAAIARRPACARFASYGALESAEAACREGGRRAQTRLRRPGYEGDKSRPFFGQALCSVRKFADGPAIALAEQVDRQTCIIHPLDRLAHSRMITSTGHGPMHKDDSPTTSTGNRLLRSMLPDDERWADRMKPFRQRKYSQLERDRLARAIRQSRRERSAETQGVSS
jgi:hypothetical protein